MSKREATRRRAASSRLKCSEGRRVSGLQIRRGQEARGLAVFGRLLVSVGEADEFGLAEGAAEEGDADGQAVDVAGRHLHVRVAGDGRGGGTAAAEVVAVHEVGRPR